MTWFINSWESSEARYHHAFNPCHHSLSTFQGNIRKLSQDRLELGVVLRPLSCQVMSCDVWNMGQFSFAGLEIERFGFTFQCHLSSQTLAEDPKRKHSKTVFKCLDNFGSTEFSFDFLFGERALIWWKPRTKAVPRQSGSCFSCSTFAKMPTLG